VTARAAPLSTLLSVAALAAALVLPSPAHAVLDGLARIAARFDTDSQIALYLVPGVDARAREALERSLRARPGIKSVRTVTREQALAELEATEGVRDLLAGLAGNPAARHDCRPAGGAQPRSPRRAQGGA